MCYTKCELISTTHDFIKTKTDSQNIYTSLNGTEYANGMFVSAGQTGGLPTFSRIEYLLLVNNSISLFCRNYECWYIEHLRSFEVTLTDSFSVYQLPELNDTVSLTAYTVDGHLLLTQKRFILIRHVRD